MSFAASPRSYVLRISFVILAVILLARLAWLQLVDDKYKILSNDITIYRKVVYPPRGIIYDRKGEVLCFNAPVFDLMMTATEVPRNFDSSRLCRVLGMEGLAYHAMHEKAKWMNGPRRQGTFIAQMTPQQTARFTEAQYDFPGFQMVERSIRSYPSPIAGLALGYIGEVSEGMLKKERFSTYRQGDYVGLNGLELTYEEVLRGQRGIEFWQKDNFNRPKDHFKGGKLDTPAIAGQSLELYIDKELQAYGEKLMQNKLGSAVAIDPATGGILAFVSSPSYDPNLMRGADRSRNYAALYAMMEKPLLNRAMQASYQPGSTQKPLTALIALDEKVITPAYGYPCGGGYNQCGRHIACTHSGGGHAANLRLALANSCNAYFCHLYRMSADAKQFGNVKEGLHAWYQYMYNFGYGHKSGVDLPYESTGTLFDSIQYNKMYKGVWNSCTNVFIGMGQGEIAATPIQMANAMCIIANRGFYYLPHLVKSIGKNPGDSVLAPYLVKHVATHIPDADYETVGLGMMDVVVKGTGRVAQLPGVEVCAKTGTVENTAAVGGIAIKMQNHSMFVAFAPRINPKICIAVCVENAGFGATWAGPVASLMIEKYLNDTISTKRHALEEKMFSGVVKNKYLAQIDSADRQKARLRDAARLGFINTNDSTYRRKSREMTKWYLEAVLRKQNGKAQH